jgi:hypothetical protein
MPKEMKQEPRFPNKLLITGMTLVLAGAIFLLWTLDLFPEFLTWLIALWPIPFILGGLVMLYLVYLKGKTDRFILPGMILVFGGIFFLLYNSVIPEKSFTRIWPAFMDIAGISLLPYAMKRKRRTRIGLLISAGTLIVLSILFFPFSLKLVGMDFLHFVFKWWPAIIISIGLGLILTYSVIRRKRKKKTAPSGQNTDGGQAKR